MTYIYSNDEVEGVMGAHIAPHYFDRVEPDAIKVYANDEKIIKAYQDVGVEVIQLDAPKKKTK